MARGWGLTGACSQRRWTGTHRFCARVAQARTSGCFARDYRISRRRRFCAALVDGVQSSCVPTRSPMERNDTGLSPPPVLNRTNWCRARTRMARALVIGVAIGALAFPVAAAAQMSSCDLYVRIDQLENQVRQLTGDDRAAAVPQPAARGGGQAPAGRERSACARPARCRSASAHRTATGRCAAAGPTAGARRLSRPSRPPATRSIVRPPLGRASIRQNIPSAPGAPRPLGSAYVTPPPVQRRPAPAEPGEQWCSDRAMKRRLMPGARQPAGSTSPAYAPAAATAPPSPTPRDSL